MYSIELSEFLYSQVKKRFANSEKINLFNDDSKDLLPKFLIGLKEKAIFWLDAHYSGDITAKGEKETPIINELETILKHDIN